MPVNLFVPLNSTKFDKTKYQTLCVSFKNATASDRISLAKEIYNMLPKRLSNEYNRRFILAKKVSDIKYVGNRLYKFPYTMKI